MSACDCGAFCCNCPVRGEPAPEPDLEYICPPQWVRDPPPLPCPHGRASWQMCPHCNGLNGAILKQYREAFRELAK